MKKRVVVAMVSVLGLLVGATYAAACGGCGDGGACNDQQVVQQFKSETARVSAELKAKDLELRNEYSMESINVSRTAALEGEIRELKAKIRTVGAKLGLPACCTV